jgi:hypothetical protein
MWACDWLYSSNVVQKHSVYGIKVRLILHDCLILKLKTLCCCEGLVPTHPITPRHILAHSTVQWYRCVNVVSSTSRVFFLGEGEVGGVGWGVWRAGVQLQIKFHSFATLKYTVPFHTHNYIPFALNVCMYVCYSLLLYTLTWMNCSFIHSVCYICVTPWLSAQGPPKTHHLLSYWNPSWLFVSVWVSWTQLWG